MEFKVLMDFFEEKLWFMWSLYGFFDGRKLICLVFVYFIKMVV